MDLSSYIKKISLPTEYTPPTQLTYEDIVAIPLSREDLQEDLHAVNNSIEIIQKTRGGSWPQEELSEEFNILDLSWHEREFRDHDSFAYVVYDVDKKYIGCFYLYPMGLRTTLSEELQNYDVDASWWVTTEAYNQGYYQKLYLALKQWLGKELPFNKVYYSNKEIPS